MPQLTVTYKQYGLRFDSETPLKAGLKSQLRVLDGVVKVRINESRDKVMIIVHTGLPQPTMRQLADQAELIIRRYQTDVKAKDDDGFSILNLLELGGSVALGALGIDW